MFRKKMLYPKISVIGIGILMLIGSFLILHSYVVKKNASAGQLFVRARVLSSARFTSYFKGFNFLRNRLVSMNYKAIEVEITNKSNENYVIDRNGIDMPLVGPQRICNKLKAETVLGHVVAASAAIYLFIVPFGFAAIPSVLAGGTIGASTSMLNIAAANNAVAYNVRTRCYDTTHAIAIPPCETVRKVIFVPRKSMPEAFSLRVRNLSSNKNLAYRLSLDKALSPV